LIGAEGVRLLRDLAGEVRPLSSGAGKLAHARPAESERLKWKSTPTFNRAKIKKEGPFANICEWSFLFCKLKFFKKLVK